ncbi:MAG: hypothetical protein C4288_22335 [Leptolyngbya sp. ERB_1_1]
MFENEFEAEYDREGECEYASEYENEDFFPLLPMLLQTAAPIAIQALSGLAKKPRRRRRYGQREFEFENENENEFESNSFAMSEGEFEAGSMNESEALMEYFAYKAATSESEAEAEAFLGALIPLAAKLMPVAKQVVTAAAPSLIEGVASLGKSLYNDRSTRRLVETVPDILKGAITNLAQQASQGQSIDSAAAIRALSGSTATMFGNPKRVAKTMKKSHRAQHRHHARRNRRRHPAYT